MTEPIRWGIIGTGYIADLFAKGLRVLPDAALVAVGSRTRAAADAFADRFDIPHRHDSYEALARDPDVDVVYVSTPHPMHKRDCIMCLEAGKAVLCEKPFTINAGETEDVIKCAREHGLFLMEAMWTRFIPAVVKVRELLAEGVIGEVRFFQADFGFYADVDASHRLLNLDLGGGALLDVGIYPISFASMVFGQQPADMASLAHIGDTGADLLSGIVFRYEQGQIACLSCSVKLDTPQEATIVGTKGHIRVHSPFWQPDGLTVSVSGKSDDVISLPKVGNGYNYEAAEVMACLRAGKLESESLPLDESLAIMHTLDRIRAQWGLKYPVEA